MTRPPQVAAPRHRAPPLQRAASHRPPTGTPAPGGRPAPPRGGRGRRFGYVPALDGLRGIGVVYVLLYHAGVAHVPGAILTMDMFFALSGFLITSLLVAEWQRTGRISLKAFWVRRARRLAPALVLALLGVAAYIHFVADAADRASLRADALSTLGYSANWRFVFAGKGYFDQFAQPSPLLHTWSLSVEEQFYLFWPLVAIALCALARRRRELWLTLAAFAGALGSALLMALLARRGVDPSRLYYGTDTRAQCLLVGAVLGAAQLAPGWRVPTVVRRLLPLLGVVALGLLITSWHVVDTRSSWLYQGGFLAVVVITMVIVAAVTESPNGVLARVLSVRLVLYLGQISYGLYLYHWPIFLWLTHARTGLSGTALLAARLGVTFAAAVVSYHLVENPIRTGTFRLPRPRFTVAATATCVAGVVVVAAAGGGSASSAISGYDEATGQINGGAPTPAARRPDFRWRPPRPRPACGGQPRAHAGQRAVAPGIVVRGRALQRRDGGVWHRPRRPRHLQRRPARPAGPVRAVAGDAGPGGRRLRPGRVGAAGGPVGHSRPRP